MADIGMGHEARQSEMILMDFQKALLTYTGSSELLAGHFGIERETQRVTTTGALAQTPHPRSFGSRRYHPYIQTDFAETQLELVTPKASSIPELLDWLWAIHEVVLQTVPKTELLWPLSMPPALPEDEAQIMIAKLTDPKAVAYRQHIGQVYGRRKQMISGIHFNYEFSPALIQHLYQQQDQITDFESFKGAFYFKVARNYLHYEWLITYLFGASPMSEANFFVGTQPPTQPVRCIRTSHFGYTNHKDVQVSYATIERYLADLDRLVQEGHLSAKKEFYAPVRLRGGHQVADLTKQDIQYMELRNIDINPFETVGLSKAQIEFLQLFLLYMVWADETQPADTWVQTGRQKNELVALEHPLAITAYQSEGLALMATMKQMCQCLQLPSCLSQLCDRASLALKKPNHTLAGQLYHHSQLSTQHTVAQQLALNHDTLLRHHTTLLGFETLPVFTQHQLFRAIQAGDPSLVATLTQPVAFAKRRTC